MATLDRQARIAGLWFLAVILLAPLRLIVVPDGTALDLLANVGLFRVGMVADLACGAAMLGLTLALRHLFNQVNPGWTRAVVLLGGVMPAALYTVNVANDAVAVLIAKGGGALSDAFAESQRMALAEIFLRLHDRIVLASELYWGLWLLPLGFLVWHARFLPRFFSVWLVLNGLAYIVQCVVGFTWPPMASMLGTICAPIQFGEIAFALWLLCFGARPGLRSGNINS